MLPWAWILLPNNGVRKKLQLLVSLNLAYAFCQKVSDMQTLHFILHKPLTTCLSPLCQHDVSVQTFYLLFALCIVGQINKKDSMLTAEHDVCPNFNCVCVCVRQRLKGPKKCSHWFSAEAEWAQWTAHFAVTLYARHIWFMLWRWTFSISWNVD